MPIPLQRETWWRMPQTRPPMGGVRRPKGWWRVFLPYWAGALALAYGIHVDAVPVRHWLAMAASAPGEAPVQPVEMLPTDPKPAPPSPGEPTPNPEPARPLALAELDLEDSEDVPSSAGGVAEPSDDQGHATDDPVTTSDPTERVEPDDEDFSHLWAVEDPVLTRPPEPEPRERRADSRTDEPLEKPRPTSREKEPPKEERIVKRSGGSSSGRSCEAAIASYREKVTMGDDDTPADITAARYGAVLNRGSYFSHCGVPESTAIHICAAVQNGRAVGVTVTTTPRSRAIERCVAGAVRGLGFPSHPRMDVTRTTFE
ncbi:MAG: hypothetical protein RIF41_22310 [Polyangiaceae bacterium]